MTRMLRCSCLTRQLERCPLLRIPRYGGKALQAIVGAVDSGLHHGTFIAWVPRPVREQRHTVRPGILVLPHHVRSCALLEAQILNVFLRPGAGNARSPFALIVPTDASVTCPHCARNAILLTSTGACTTCCRRWRSPINRKTTCVSRGCLRCRIKWRSEWLKSTLSRVKIFPKWNRC